MVEPTRKLVEHAFYSQKVKREDGKKAYWIQYMEQRLYYLCLMELSEKVIETANELIMYPYRSADLWKSDYQQIIDWYSLSNEEEPMPVNKHKLWKCFWY